MELIFGTRWIAPALVLAVGCLWSSQELRGQPAGGGPERYALLVGVTSYPNLGKEYQLEGPGNDVVLFRQLLVEKFRFAEKNIVTLAEAVGTESRRPTFANIKREFEALAQKARPHDQIVILLAGHGVQVPDQDPPQPDDPEPDGLDEAFLPADVRDWKQEKIDPHLIRDDDLRVWIKKVTDRGPYVWVVADCCHSGTLLRAANLEKLRQVPPTALGIPPQAIAAARRRAERVFGKIPGGNRDAAPFIKGEDRSNRLVGLYASHPNEPTVEVEPKDVQDARYHGLLTYHLCQVLSTSKEIPTYRSLVQAIDDEYKRQGRRFPTPMLEGKEKDREVLGVKVWPAPPFRLLKRSDQWRLNAGRLHGLTEKSILAVYPPEGNQGKPVGHVRITRILVQSAEVEPCAYDGQPAPKDLPDRGRCQVVLVDFGDLRLRVAVAPRTTKGMPVPEKEQMVLKEHLRQLEKAEGSVIRLADAASKEVQWLATIEENQAYLLPVEGLVQVPGRKKDSWFGPFPLHKDLAPLKGALRQIARVSNLVKLTNPPEGQRGTSPSRVQVGIEVLKYKNPDDLVGLPIARGAILHPGEVIAIRVHNQSRTQKIGPTILFLDSGFGIKCLYPLEGDAVQPLSPGHSFSTEKQVLGGDTLGLEQVIGIGVPFVPGKGAADFSVLEQRTLPRLRGPNDVLQSPLGQLLAKAVWGKGATRGAKLKEANHYAIVRTWWNTE